MPPAAFLMLSACQKDSIIGGYCRMPARRAAKAKIQQFWRSKNENVFCPYAGIVYFKAPIQRVPIP